MDCIKFGGFIRSLRLNSSMTQKQLAEKLGISDKAISKWERGLSCPDISLLSELADLFRVSIEDLLNGEIFSRGPSDTNMKNAKFYVCPDCGNVILASSDCDISCCGRLLPALSPVKVTEEQKLKVELIENYWYVTSDHPMTKDNYISFAAYLTGGEAHIIRQYPEWDFQVRFLKYGHGKLVWYAKADGLLYQLI